MQRPDPNCAICFENDQHRFEIVNVRRDKEMFAPEARLYSGGRVSLGSDSATDANKADHRKIFCKLLQTNFGSVRYGRIPQALPRSFAAVLEEHHALAD
jgi:hypothetical protein